MKNSMSKSQNHYMQGKGQWKLSLSTINPSLLMDKSKKKYANQLLLCLVLPYSA